MVKAFLTILFTFIILLLPYSAFAAQTVSTTFSPANLTAKVGDDITVVISGTPDDDLTAQIYDVEANFDKDKLQLKSIEYLLGVRDTTQGYFGDLDNTNVINGRGNPAPIYLHGNINDNNTATIKKGQSTPLVKLTFTVQNVSGIADVITYINVLGSSSNTPSSFGYTDPVTKIAILTPLSEQAMKVTIPQAAQAATCTGLSLPGLGTPSTNTVGGNSYTVSSTGATSSISVSGTPSGVRIATPVGSAGLTVTPFTTGTGWSLTVPANNSLTADANYTLDASVGPEGSTVACNQATIKVSKATLPACTYSSTQVEFRKDSTVGWSQSGSANPNQPVSIAAFHNSTGLPAGDTALSILDPDNLVVVTTTSNNISTFTPTKLGTYVVSTTTTGYTGTACTASLNLTVAVPACIYTSTQVEFRKSSTDNWSASGSVYANQPVYIAGFHNAVGLPAADVTFSVTDPSGNPVLTAPAGTNIVSFTPTANGTYNIFTTTTGVATTGTGATACTGSLSLTVGSAPTYTTAFRIAESPTDLSTAQWQPYTDKMTLIHTLISPLKNNEERFIFVQFQRNDNTISDVFSKSIKYTPDPTISNLDCHQSSSGVGTAIIIKGANFGVQGKGQIKVGDSNAKVTRWDDRTDTITVNLDQRLAGDTPVTVQIDDGRSVTANCTIDTTSVEFQIKNDCKLAGQFAADNVDIKVFEAVPGVINPQPIQHQKISFDKDGNPQGFAPKFETGKDYEIIIKAPGALARRVEFQALPGTTVLDPVSLPVGDIAPASSPDGKINSLDKAELVRQWSLAGDVTRTGDFNIDGRVNSIDYACMIKNFNQSDDVYTPPVFASSPLPSSLPVGSSTPSASLTPVQTSTPSATLSPSLSPSPSPSGL